jgi:hypothetical protein
MANRRQVSMYIDSGVYMQAKVIAAATNRNIYQLVEDALNSEILKHVSISVPARPHFRPKHCKLK